ncbi:MAG: putative toxin-antitoxin system toxin component, PIN family [Bacteroidales bacterium]|nr:putative toxin-antitoxin system toxin component, PIN family [Bacteroidales bacterium]
MRVVLDTNVLVAAFATRGLCAELFEVCLTDHRIILSEHILHEVKENLLSKIQLPQNMVQEIMDYLKEETETVNPEKIKGDVCRDKDDILIIGTALRGKAKFIITGDEDPLVLKKYNDIQIVTPREFWSRLAP